MARRKKKEEEEEEGSNNNKKMKEKNERKKSRRKEGWEKGRLGERKVGRKFYGGNEHVPTHLL